MIWEENQKGFQVYPYIEIIDSLDALPLFLDLPDSVDFGERVTPFVRVKNLGFTPSNIPTRLKIGSSYNQIRSKMIGPNQEDTFYFLNWTANQTGWANCSLFN